MQKKSSSKKSPHTSKLNVQGWRTSDDDEIERRRLRGVNEPFIVKALTANSTFFNDYRVTSNSGGSYRVEIRSLLQPINSCDCPDHGVNRLGTCKHVEAVLYKLAKGKKRAFQQAADTGSPTVEIYHDRRDDQLRVLWPQLSRPGSSLQIAGAFFCC